jgi:hypothetical protein
MKMTCILSEIGISKTETKDKIKLVNMKGI